jgi:hypothetical protein
VLPRWAELLEAARSPAALLCWAELQERARLT